MTSRAEKLEHERGEAKGPLRALEAEQPAAETPPALAPPSDADRSSLYSTVHRRAA